MNQEFKEQKVISHDWHCLEWDENKISRFWGFIQESEAHRQNYFTKYYNKAIVKFLRYLVPLEGRILDYGCGIGYLSEYLLSSGISCEGCDFSQESVNFINQKFDANPLWQGAKLISSSELPYESNSLDLILCVETIEHILDGFLDNTLSELYRILKPKSGRLFITTPHNENLEASMVFCPDCYAVFHQTQHLRKFDIDTLKNLMENHIFMTELCNSTDFDLLKSASDIYSPWDVRLNRWIWIRDLIWKAIQLQAKFLDFCNPPKNNLSSEKFKKIIGCGRHLFWIGYKP